MSIASQLSAALSGRYTVEREIGAGGMATVYLARDIKHDRNVALKVLSPELGAVLGAERFLSEIRVTANLQHPNLLPLFDSGEANGLLFYVMPFVEGESLRARLDREKQLPVDEAVRIASAIASALEYAHAHHVIHRDLKPDNILIQGGQPVIADFGIALAVSNAGGARVTQTGLSLGTPQYMSPEQATGDRQIDARTDIYSLAAVTYEMLVGDPPHLGSTAQAIIAKVLTERPSNVRVARPSVPEHTAYAVEKGLEKLPADRWRTASEFDAALTGRTGMAETLSSFRANARTSAAPQHGPIARALSTPIVAGALALIALASAAGWWKTAHRTVPATPVRLTLESPHGATVVGSGDALAVSPDGRTIVFVARDSAGNAALYARALNDVVPHLLAGTEGATRPFFSPNGRWVGFHAEQQIKKAPLDGGSVVSLADVGTFTSASWGNNGIIYLSENGRLASIPENGGAPRPVLGNDSSTARGERWPLVLDGDETVLYTLWSGSRTDAKIVARSVATGAVTDLGVQGVSAIAVLDGFLVYTNGAGALLAVPFDPRALRVTGEPQQIFDGVSTGGAGDHPPALLSKSGSLVYQAGSVLREVVLGDLRGNAAQLWPDQKAFDNPRISPDGNHVAFAIPGRASSDIWLYNRSTGSSTRLTAEGTANSRPEWTRDSKRILFRSNRRDSISAVWWQPIDGSGPPERILAVPGKDIWEVVLSPDGETILFRTGTSGSADIWYRRLTGDTAVKPFAATPFTEYDARFSPDGKWVAYSSDELGARQVFVRPFPSGGGRMQVSTDGGTQPVWSRDGTRLYYVRRSNSLLSARITLNPTFSVVGRDTVTRAEYYYSSGHAGYDVSSDGEHVLLLRNVSMNVPTIVVAGWIEEWRAQRAAAAKQK